MQELKAWCRSSLLWFCSAFHLRQACSASYDTPCLAAITHLITTANHHRSDLAMFQGDWVLMVYVSSTKPPEEPTCSYLLLLCRTHLFFLFYVLVWFYLKRNRIRFSQQILRAHTWSWLPAPWRGHLRFPRDFKTSFGKKKKKNSK